tara:strand:- start:2194 stop:2697 length:504 start_codon:yes stop_codon:yes gene_type:complete
MKPGNRINICLAMLLFISNVFAEEKILTTPLINLDELKPSFEEVEDPVSNNQTSFSIQNKKESKNENNAAYAKLIGLDKITAKTSEIIVNLGETKKFGPLEIKVLKCGSSNLDNKINNVAYLQVKDLTESDNEKVFIFNGWTFSSDPDLAPFDHAIYDLQLVHCNNT